MNAIMPDPADSGETDATMRQSNEPCPPWCEGHTHDVRSSHMSRQWSTGPRDGIYSHAVILCVYQQLAHPYASEQEPIPMLMLIRNHGTKVDGVYPSGEDLSLSISDARALASVLEVTGAAELATLIREACALVDAPAIEASQPPAVAEGQHELVLRPTAETPRQPGGAFAAGLPLLEGRVVDDAQLRALSAARTVFGLDVTGLTDVTA